MFRAFFRRKNERLFGECVFDCVRFCSLFLLSQMSCAEKVEKCTSTWGGCIIVDVNDDDDENDESDYVTAVGGDEPHRLNIVYIRSSKSIRRRFLFLGSTRERVSAGPSHIIRRCGGNMNEKGEKSDRRRCSVNVLRAFVAQRQRYFSRNLGFVERKVCGKGRTWPRCRSSDIINKSRSSTKLSRRRMSRKGS